MVAQYLHSKARQNHLSLSFGTLLFWKGDVLRGSGQNPMTDLPWLLNTHSFQLFYHSRACVCLDLFMPLLHKEARRGCTCLTFLSSPPWLLERTPREPTHVLDPVWTHTISPSDLPTPESREHFASCLLQPLPCLFAFAAAASIRRQRGGGCWCWGERVGWLEL